MNVINDSAFTGSVWYQEAYFLRFLQDEMDSARQQSTPLCLIVLRVPECSRRAARHLYAYAQSEASPAFFGILSNGDYAICMPGSGYMEGADERRALADRLGDFGVCSGMAVLAEDETAADFLRVATGACVDSQAHAQELWVA
jgi:hypothetical protein